MKLLVDIKDEKAPFVLEVLKHFKYVKARELTPEDSSSNVLSFSGAWKDIDNDVFMDLTDNLSQNRRNQRNSTNGQGSD